MFSGHVISVFILRSNILSLDSSCDYFKMGKITLEMLAKSPSHTKKRKDETVQQYVRRLTHLYFSEKNIDEIVSRYVISVKFHRLFDSGSIGNLVVCIPIHLVIMLLVIHIRSYCYASLWLNKVINCSVSLQHSNMHPELTSEVNWIS